MVSDVVRIIIELSAHTKEVELALEKLADEYTKLQKENEQLKKDKQNGHVGERVDEADSVGREPDSSIPG